MITIEQIKAARGLLDWTQEDLANFAKLSKAAINNLERRIVTPRMETLKVIEQTFSDAGVEFTEGPGVKLKGEELKVYMYEGQDSVYRLHNDIFETLKDSGGELLISGVNEEQFVKSAGERLLKLLEKMRKHGISSRLLSLEGDKYFIEPASSYRWVSPNLFSQVPYLVYGKKYAIILFGAPSRVVLVENEAVANSYRKQFNNNWDGAKIPD